MNKNMFIILGFLLAYLVFVGGHELTHATANNWNVSLICIFPFCPQLNTLHNHENSNYVLFGQPLGATTFKEPVQPLAFNESYAISGGCVFLGIFVVVLFFCCFLF